MKRARNKPDKNASTIFYALDQVFAQYLPTPRS
jgi:hypothetical protein